MNNNAPAQSSAYKQIRNLLIVIFAGIGAAGYFAFMMINHYGPSGKYLVSNILLAPETLPLLNYKEVNPATGKMTNLVFNGLEFAYWQPKLRNWQRMSISQNAYQQLYRAIQNDTSLDDTANISDLFYTAPPATLTISVHAADDNRNTNSKNFQAVQFAAEGNYFRIELHEQQNSTNWAYFSHAAIYKEAMQLLSEE